MKNLLRLEEVAIFGLSLFMYTQLPYGWEMYALLILAPDISMVGYLAGPAMGALLYNTAHHRGMALALWGAGYYFGISPLMLAGVILFSHASLDRIFGYGFKYSDLFKHTHLQEIPARVSSD